MNTQIQSMQNNNQKIVCQIISNTKNKDNSTPNIPPIGGDRLVEADLARFEQLMITLKIPQAKWPGKLYPALCGKALEVYHQMPLVHSNSYNHIKVTFLLHAGITPEGKLQEIMSNPPPPNQTAVNMLGHFQGILQQILHGQTFNQICWTLALEFTYKYTAKHIVSFVRSLHLVGPLDCALEMDQYISSKHLPREKLWLKHQHNRRPLNHYQGRQSHSAHQDNQEEQQPPRYHPSTPSRNTQNTMPRENHTITQPNPNNQNQYSRRPPQMQGTRA